MFGKNKSQTFSDKLLLRAGGSEAKILLPEATDERVIEAAAMAVSRGLCNVVLLGKRSIFEGVLPSKILNKIQFLDPNDSALQLKYASKLYELRKEKGMTIEEAAQKVCQKMYFSVLALKCGDVDGIVAGATTHTADVLRPALQIIKTAEGIKTASSCFVIETKNKNYGENGVLIFGDCGVVENPTSEQLCDIAIACANSAKTVASFDQPKVALLSYSTKSQNQNNSEQIQKVKDAFLAIRRKDSSLLVDGELQVDAALVPEVANQKCPHSALGGKANVLVFPDLNSGNISYKLVARLAGATAIGPIVQGLAKPVNDVSRGATSTEILLAMAVTALQAQKKIKN